MSYPSPDNTPYRPANGTEGEIFETEFCLRCSKWRGGNCGINLRASMLNEDEKGYPKQWVWQGQQPACTAFVLKGTQPRRVRTERVAKEQGELFV